MESVRFLDFMPVSDAALEKVAQEFATEGLKALETADPEFNLVVVKQAFNKLIRNTCRNFMDNERYLMGEPEEGEETENQAEEHAELIPATNELEEAIQRLNRLRTEVNEESTHRLADFYQEKSRHPVYTTRKSSNSVPLPSNEVLMTDILVSEFTRALEHDFESVRHEIRTFDKGFPC